MLKKNLRFFNFITTSSLWNFEHFIIFHHFEKKNWIVRSLFFRSICVRMSRNFGMCIWDDGGGVTAAAEQNFEKMAPQSSPKFKTTSSISHKFVPRYIRYSSSKRQIFLTHDFYDSLAHKGNYRIDLLLLYQHRTLSTYTLTDRNYYKYIFSFK